MTCEALTGMELQLCRVTEATEAAADAAGAARSAGSRAETFATFVEALTSLILPLVLAFVVWRLWPLLGGLLERRSFTIKVAGFELSAQEATDQLRRQIEDLQAELTALKEARTGVTEADGGAATTGGGTEGGTQRKPAHLRILWVDDIPQNNAFEISALRDRGHEVVTATSSDEALRLLDETEVDVVLSDIGRPEGRDAGIDLLRRLRRDGDATPFGFYTSRPSLRRHEAELVRLAPFVATAASTELLRGVAALEKKTTT